MLNKDYNNVSAYGEIDERGYVHLGSTENGFCYKNPRVYFTNPDEICYIREFGFEDIPETVPSDREGNYLFADYKKYGCGLSANDILNDCNNNKYIADIVFDLIDWQNPNAKYLEVLEEVDEGDYDYEAIHKNEP